MKLTKQLFITLVVSTCFMSVNGLVFGQSTITLSQFLASSQQDPAVQLEQSKLEFLNNEKNFSLPFIRELELRTETNDLEIMQQEYVLRANPHSLRQIKAQKQLHVAQSSLTTNQQQIELKNALTSRYNWIVNWLEIAAQRSFKEKLLLNLQDQMNILKKTSSDLNFDYKDLIRIEEDILEIETDLLSLQNRKELLLNQLGNYYTSAEEIIINNEQIIGIEEVLSFMNLKEVDATNHYDLARKENRIQVLNAENEVELSDRYNPISYGQVKIGGRNYENFREYVSFSVGINLPVKGDSHLKINEIALDKLEESGEYLILKQEIEQDQAALINDVQVFQKRQQFLQTQLNESQVKYMLGQLLQRDDTSPLDILKLKAIILERQWDIDKIEWNILEKYVDWLNISDTILEAPIKNHLVKSREVIFNN